MNGLPLGPSSQQMVRDQWGSEDMAYTDNKREVGGRGVGALRGWEPRQWKYDEIEKEGEVNGNLVGEAFGRGVMTGR